MAENKKMLVGMSYARSFKELGRWKAFLNELGIDYVISDKNLHEAAASADKRFRYSQEYCFTRRATLGEYVYLVEEVGCNILMAASRVVEGNAKCNTIRYVPAQIAEYYREKNIKVIDACISTNKTKAFEQLKCVARYLVDDEERIVNAASAWLEYAQENVKKRVLVEGAPTIFIIGSASFHFSLEGPSYMTRYLTEKLNVNLVGPKTASDKKNAKIYREAYAKVYHKNLLNVDRMTYWDRPTILGTLLNVKESIDGVIFVRDKYCACKIEEVDFLQQIIDRENIPNIVIDYREENRTTTETILETFVEMIRNKS
ncbi:MAG: hypothetical protein K6G30_03780 [Acetatifactor sp.]|nr:hypothetical protein [Acetatifactor sp.]